MGVATKRIVATVTITGQSQSATTEDILGIVDQIIVESSTSGQSFDIILLNENAQEIYRNNGYALTGNNNSSADIRPRLLPRSAVTVRIENPINTSGTVTLTFIEQEHV